MLATSTKPESALAAFDAVAESYDDVFTRSPIGRAQRAAVHAELGRVFSPGQRILELNCGTGVDALYLGSLGVEVLACDASPRMIAVARGRGEAGGYSTSVPSRRFVDEFQAPKERHSLAQGEALGLGSPSPHPSPSLPDLPDGEAGERRSHRMVSEGLRTQGWRPGWRPGLQYFAPSGRRGPSCAPEHFQPANAELRVLATERIAELEAEGPFDGAFSNFGGLNCVEDLGAVARQLARLLRPGARVLLCMFGRTAAWEIVWYLAHGNPRKALRRFTRGGAAGHVADGSTVKVQYPSVRAMIRTFAPEFRLVSLKGIGVTVPPSYASGFAERFPRALGAMIRFDARLSKWPALRGLADHILLEFQRVPRV